MMDATDEPAKFTPAERASKRRYQAEMIAAGLLYAGLVAASVAIVSSVNGPLKILVAVAPAFGAAAMAIAMIRYVLELDELQRRTYVDAAGIALVATAVASIALAFLENAGLPRAETWWIWIVAVASWSIALPFVRRRYA